MRFVNQNQYDFYWENGYLVIEKFFTDAEVDLFYESVKKVATEDYKILLQLDREEDLLRQNPNSREEDRVSISKLIRWIQFHPRMVGILEELYKREIGVVQSIVIFKEKGTPFADQAWNPHQDNSYAQNPNGMYIAVGYPLLDFSPDNGGLYVYPGSHKEGLLPMKPVEGARQQAGESPGNLCDVPEEYNDKKLDIVLQKGDVIIFHGDLIHGSYPNTSNHSRPFMVINYLPYGEEFLPGRTSRRVMTRCH